VRPPLPSVNQTDTLKGGHRTAGRILERLPNSTDAVRCPPFRVSVWFPCRSRRKRRMLRCFIFKSLMSCASSPAAGASAGMLRYHEVIFNY
jgi:hypothetical protein